MFEDIIELIKQVSEDRSVPRNIREKCTDCIKTLDGGKDPVDIRINTVISTLDEVSNDPNIPMYTRTQIWNIVSLLESRRK
ncbi:MAG: UPF0147 family protein [Nanoarchaeota archaeon]|nr:UPF0147 family protein [Nanoarchaeota archaeon]MBU4124525.1 UPF0147 family protein [Nanoarchaeota archaeon]